MHRTRPLDAGLYAMVLSFLLADFLPGPTVTVAIGLGIASVVAALARSESARMLLGTTVGTFVGVLGIVALASAHH